MRLRHKLSPSPDERWQRQHPFGEPGSVDYWVEAMNRAYELGETRAAGERDKLVALTGPQPPREFTSFPHWFWNLWMSHLAPGNEGRTRLAMPY